MLMRFLIGSIVKRSPLEDNWSITQQLHHGLKRGVGQSITVNDYAGRWIYLK